MQVDLTPFEAITTYHGLASQYSRTRDFLYEKGCPSFVVPMYEENMEAKWSAMKKLIGLLRAEGFPMTDSEPEVLDWAKVPAKG